ncbi:protein-export chaperone SecB [Jannaschia sp. S6380]|uniref:protein-export chaperone SecB n=1 Tax=Jannaschia sp. S6380 TaxID=2926408 RepID=UPI001FF2D38D|nr:protein-export chaperone SecB [Jannaschia sp. S6380]MCK0168438.1 protein-export chaperone SecB [Jannaschia sp. S6380]
MADEENTQTTPEAEGTKPQQTAQQTPQMQVLGQFIRDLSFENVAVQKGRALEGQPDINVQVGLEAKKRKTEGQYEVAVKLNVTGKVKGADDPIFAIELDYAGVFAISNVPENQLHPYLMIECPRMLFPFLRRIVSDISRDGGFPPLNLENIDFVALYRNEITRRAQAEAENAPKS